MIKYRSFAHAYRDLIFSPGVFGILSFVNLLSFLPTPQIYASKSVQYIFIGKVTIV